MGFPARKDDKELQRRSAADSMEIRPTKGLKVNCTPSREAIFGEDGVEVKKTSIPSVKNRSGILTGRTLAGFTEVEMEALDGNKHWYPTDQMLAMAHQGIATVVLVCLRSVGCSEQEAGEGPWRGPPRADLARNRLLF